MGLYTKEYCEEMIKKCDNAEMALINGKSYKIGTRELERADLDEIRKIRARWENELQLIINGKPKRRARIVIPRDL